MIQLGFSFFCLTLELNLDFIFPRGRMAGSAGLVIQLWGSQGGTWTHHGM